MIRAFFGGSFDPIHAGHVAIVDLLLARSLADVVHVVPARRSPFKKERYVFAPLLRLQLVALALADRSGVVVEDMEVMRRGPSYTVKTLADLVGRHGSDRWRLIIGADQAASFAHWRQPARLLELAEPVVLARGPVVMTEPLVGRALVIEDFEHPASAVAIRRELAAGRVPGPELLPPSVAVRIRDAGLKGMNVGLKDPLHRDRI